jgi:hypothetical protein
LISRFTFDEARGTIPEFRDLLCCVSENAYCNDYDCDDKQHCHNAIALEFMKKSVLSALLHDQITTLEMSGLNER